MAFRLLYLGAVPIRPDHTGGSVVLWRHQRLFRSGTITSADSQLGYRPGWGASIWNLLRLLRLGRLALILQPWLRKWDVHFSQLDLDGLRQQADAILTVAHGLTWLQALTAARGSGLPLITVVHDWYPDASGCPRWGLWIWERSFRRLMRSSALVFAVSAGMARQIGPHPSLHVLPPIPDPQLRPCPPRQPHGGPWRLYYSGLCGGLYRPLLQELIEAVAEDARFALHLSGPAAEDLVIDAGHNPRLRYSGFLEGEAWQQAFDEADALLLVLSFERRHRRHLATHFPSKLVEYANRGRPIVIWGPPWSSAVQWGLRRDSVLCVSTPDPWALLHVTNRWLAEQPACTAFIPGFQATAIALCFNRTVEQL